MIDDFARGLIEAIAIDYPRTRRKEQRLPDGIARAATEGLLVRLLANIDLLEEFGEAMMCRFDALPTDRCGFEGDDQHRMATGNRSIPRLPFLAGLTGLSDADLYVLLLDPKEARLAHELLADARSNGELSPWWTAALAALDPAEIKFTEEFDELR